jgi:hypothetical protein
MRWHDLDVWTLGFHVLKAFFFSSFSSITGHSREICIAYGGNQDLDRMARASQPRK